MIWEALVVYVRTVKKSTDLYLQTTHLLVNDNILKRYRTKTEQRCFWSTLMSILSKPVINRVINFSVLLSWEGRMQKHTFNRLCLLLLLFTHSITWRASLSLTGSTLSTEQTKSTEMLKVLTRTEQSDKQKRIVRGRIVKIIPITNSKPTQSLLWRNVCSWFSGWIFQDY